MILLCMINPVIVVHGGAWDIPDRQVNDNLTGVKEAANKGWKGNRISAAVRPRKSGERLHGRGASESPIRLL